MEGRRLIVGDIHGNFKGLTQALGLAEFNEKDTLYAVGDYVDGHSQSKEVIEYLIALGDRFKGVIGNHDVWFRSWMNDPIIVNPAWYNQGGKATLQSYGITVDNYMTLGEIPDYHKKFFNSLPDYIITDDNICIVHAGWIPSDAEIDKSLSAGDKGEAKDYYWDRNFWYYADNHKNPPYKRVFIGHTADRTGPRRKGNIWNIDSGGGWDGVITVMDMDTEKYWQSFTGKSLYPEFKGR